MENTIVNRKSKIVNNKYRPLPQVKFLNYSNLFVSFGAMALYAESCFHFGIEVHWQHLWFVFSATLFIYIIDRLLVLKHLRNSSNPRHSWIVKNHIVLKVLVVMSAGYLGWSITWIKWNTIVYLSHLALLSVAYSVPLFGRSLRTIPGVKLLLIVYVWAVVTVVLPTMLGTGTISENVYYHVLWERVFFISMLAMAFNIRDAAADKREGLQTIPVQLGEQRAAYLAVPLGFGAIYFGILISLEYGVVMAMIDFCTAMLLWKTPRIKNEPWFAMTLDGTMIARLGLVMLVQLL